MSFVKKEKIGWNQEHLLIPSTSDWHRMHRIEFNPIEWKARRETALKDVYSNKSKSIGTLFTQTTNFYLFLSIPMLEWMNESFGIKFIATLVKGIKLSLHTAYTLYSQKIICRF